MKYQSIERRSNLSADEFRDEYLLKNKPVVFTDLTKDWAAINKWSADFFKEKYGNLQVPVFSSNYSKPGKGYMSNDADMNFKEFIEITQKGNTDLRLFLFDIFKYAPELKQDFQFPTIMDGFEKRLPFMFFGGEGSEVTMHYDIDCANVFLTQFVGNKRVVLFSPNDSKKIYHHPMTVKSLVDFKNPDLNKFPAVKNASGYETILTHGETIFMPSRYWHYMQYLDFSFGLALRSYTTVADRLYGFANLAAHFMVDKGLNAIAPQKWHSWKETKAYENAKAFEA